MTIVRSGYVREASSRRIHWPDALNRAACDLADTFQFEPRRSCNMVAEGAAAPDFTVLTDEGKQVSLRDYRGHWVVLYFYPKADTPG